MKLGGIVATIEARMTSSRLPGKLPLPANGIPMLLHLVRRLRAVPSLDAIVVATTINAADDPFAEFGARENVAVFRGREPDVLGRVIGAARSAWADTVVYVSNSVVRSYPNGMEPQVMTLTALQRSADLTDDPLDREHVSRFTYLRPDMFSLVHVVAPPSLTWPDLGLTLDEASDYELLKRVVEQLAPNHEKFGCGAAIASIRTQPDLLEVNRQFVPKGDQ